MLDATGMRVGGLEAPTWGDADEPRGGGRVSASSSKTGAARCQDDQHRGHDRDGVFDERGGTVGSECVGEPRARRMAAERAHDGHRHA